MAQHWKVFSLFYVLSFLLLAFVPILSLLLDISMDFTAVGNRASEQTGIPWTSNLFNLFRLALVEPGLFLLVFGAAVPTLAALITLLVFRLFNLRLMVNRLRPMGIDQSIGNALSYYGLLFCAIVLCLAASGLLRQYFQPGDYPGILPGFSIPLLMTILVGALTDQGGLLEEGGWRGFATAYLQKHLGAPLKVALIIGVCWSLWHLPRDIVSGLPGRLGLLTYLFMYLPAFTLGTVGVSIVASYFMNRLGGSVIPAILVHGLVNDAAGLGGAADINLALTPFHQITNAMPVMVLASVLIAVSGSALGYTQKD